ncbi:Uncharacterized protein TCM_000629 [Theobroma cacao]|uniref:Uncharacterized protein n=1 Tax=Theobroma cacao TaxID=3641 RepID=A0A061DHY1_THECC|nr:Uncharacterized protein TCM_000629 [Theobroma cacao]
MQQVVANQSSTSPAPYPEAEREHPESPRREVRTATRNDKPPISSLIILFHLLFFIYVEQPLKLCITSGPWEWSILIHKYENPPIFITFLSFLKGTFLLNGK